MAVLGGGSLLWKRYPCRETDLGFDDFLEGHELFAHRLFVSLNSRLDRNTEEEEGRETDLRFDDFLEGHELFALLGRFLVLFLFR